VPLAGRRSFPLWAIVRQSGRRYTTPVAIQRTQDRFVIPVPFGDATQWVRNVVAAGGCTVRWRGREYRALAPELLDWVQARSSFGAILRAIVPVTGIGTFLRVRAEETSSS
jgi:hypothetical protein